MPLRIEPLDRSHRPLLADFQNPCPGLVDYLRRYALRHAEKDLLARTYVAIDSGTGMPRLAGYFSLTTVSVERGSLAPLPDLNRLPRFPIPGILLARLAVDTRIRGQGLGRYLFEEALGLTLQLAQNGPVAFRLFVTDALDAEAQSFYAHFGCAPLSEGFPCRMVLDLRPLLWGQTEPDTRTAAGGSDDSSIQPIG
ncbi:GNAT family N-acetyltransferase [Allochromatium palmeri]|uniref:GNAT family N-acetyltransferase n=1 Tax=Allochromatium palmeri TaxID=231048 RepID=A0A6N8EEV2_9GAMM|nr:GNAT family N-acetyltransferase [Allochromatium palmeri]MTW20864.1 GNAT family N-acetyltransferase [Allochromatium palmeri]